MTCDAIEIVMHKSIANSLEVWRRIRSSTLSHLKGVFALVDGVPVKIEEIGRFLSKGKRRSRFNLEVDEYEIMFGSLGHADIALLIVTFRRGFCDILATQWVKSLLDAQEGISARVYSAEYQKWQNASSIQQYEIEGRDYSGLKLRPNGLPHPLNGIKIDTSGNPGLRIIKKEYIEAVGARMWLTDLFNARANPDYEYLAHHEWVRVEKNGKFHCVQASVPCFETAEGIEGKMQRIIRRCLFQREEPASGERH